MEPTASNSPSTTPPPPDAELAAVERASKAKNEVIAALVLACNARKAAGSDTTDLEEALELERLTLAGFTRAADKRRREIRIFGGRP